MSERTDLNRWNRAGLRHFRYVDGNAATFLELLRKQLAERFPEWDEVNGTIPSGETAQQRLERLLAQYRQERGSWAWEISRSFARACHILTEYADAYANEGYLGTATQWDNVRRLVEMLDYHPAPPASAATHLVLMAKNGMSGKVEKGLQVQYAPTDGGKPVVFETLEAIKVDAACNAFHPAGWNRSQKSVSDSSTVWHDAGGKGVGELELSAGDVGVLLHTDKHNHKTGLVVDITGVKRDRHVLSVSGPTPWPGFPEWQVQLLAKAKGVLRPHLNGKGVVAFDKPHGLSVGDVIGWDEGQWKYNEVIDCDATAIRLKESEHLPDSSRVVYRLHRIGKITDSTYGTDVVVFPLEFEHGAMRKNGALTDISSSDYEPFSAPIDTDKKWLCNRITDGNISEIYVHYWTDEAVGKVIATDPAYFVLDGAPKGLKSGDWVVGENSAGRYALCIDRIEEREHTFTIDFSPLKQIPSPPVGRISEGFGNALRRLQLAMDESVLQDKTLGYFIHGEGGDLPVSAIQGVGIKYANDLNGPKSSIQTIRDLLETSQTSAGGISVVLMREFKAKAEMIVNVPVDSESESLSDQLVYDLLAISDSIAVGSEAPVIIDSLDRIYGPFEFTLYPEDYDRNETCLDAAAEITLAGDPPAGLEKNRSVLLACGPNTLLSKVEGISGQTVTLADTIKADTFVRADTLLYANVVPAGHGERQPEKVLGSGEAAQANQSFVLAVNEVAFVSDATMGAGVRADIDVIVGEQIWTQVSSLTDSAPSDPHYVIRMTEKGYVRILFGDGVNGRTLPTGRNNVRVHYRLGNGLSGNVAAGRLEKVVKPHPLIQSVRQPVNAAGGADMEGVASMRELAPSTLLTLERAVSLDDFSSLAGSNSSVWQAAAFRQADVGGRQEHVQVVVVPAGGAVSTALCGSVQAFLQQHAMPGVRVQVTSFKPQPIGLTVVIRIRTKQFVAEDVVKAVRAALLDGFSLKQRRLAEPLYISEVYKLVERVTGVENSYCGFGGDSAAKVIRPDGKDSVIYLDDGLSMLDITYEEYRP